LAVEVPQAAAGHAEHLGATHYFPRLRQLVVAAVVVVAPIRLGKRTASPAGPEAVVAGRQQVTVEQAPHHKATSAATLAQTTRHGARLAAAGVPQRQAQTLQAQAPERVALAGLVSLVQSAAAA
jgi:hypothetical protein